MLAWTVSVDDRAMHHASVNNATSGYVKRLGDCDLDECELSTLYDMSNKHLWLLSADGRIARTENRQTDYALIRTPKQAFLPDNPEKSLTTAQVISAPKHSWCANWRQGHLPQDYQNDNWQRAWQAGRAFVFLWAARRWPPVFYRLEVPAASALPLSDWFSNWSKIGKNSPFGVDNFN